MRAGERDVEFERYRAHLVEVAYRILGTLTDAEDAVQEAYLRFSRRRPDELRDVRAWLTTVVARICLDELGSARARRESYVGPWLPEPLVGAAGDRALSGSGPGPEDRVTLDESVSMAMLVLLETLSPAERTAFVLREVFGLSYAEVSAVVGRSEGACRQLVARARRHVQDRAPRFTA
ncbi:sigma-70 family RNA polymerase sigma factor, partial [Actinomadura adrarensis]